MIRYLSAELLEKVFLGFAIFSSLLIPILLYNESDKILAIIFAIPIFIYIIISFKTNFRFFFIFSIFFGTYIYTNARLQLVNIISYILILFFLLNHSSEEFHNFRLPLSMKIISLLFVCAVFISSINTPYRSFWSLYYSFMFFTYIFTGYVVFKSVKDLSIINNYINYFYKSVAFFGIFIIIQILLTGEIRSFGLSGPTISDILAMALLIAIFKCFVLGNKYNKTDLIATAIIFITLITTLSRFSWVGFLSSFLYGIIIASLVHTNRKEFLTKKIIYFSAGAAFVTVLIFVTGFHQIIISRFLDVDLTILDSNKEGGVIGNSLDMRALIWITAFNTFLQNKLTGVGYFMFHKVSENYNILPENIYIDIVMGLDAHSTFMNFLAETGILGVSMYIIYLCTAFYYSFKAIKYSITERLKNNSLILNILIFFIFTTSIYSGAFTFGYNGFVLHAIVALVVANYVFTKKNYEKNIEKNHK